MGLVDTMFRRLRSTVVPAAPSESSTGIREVYTPGKPLIVLVPGYLYHQPIMRPMATRFERNGFQADYLSAVVNARHEYEHQQQLILDHLASQREVLAQIPRIILIGHATGGLHAYEIASRLQKEGLYTGEILVIALSTPFRYKPNFFEEQFLKAGLAMRGATTIRLPKVPRNFVPSTTFKVLSVTARNDEVVNRRMATLFDGWSQYSLDTNHSGLIYEKIVFHKLLALVEGRTF